MPWNTRWTTIKKTKKNSHNQSKTPAEDCKQQEQQKKKSWEQVSENMRKTKEVLVEGRDGVFAIGFLVLTKTKTLWIGWIVHRPQNLVLGFHGWDEIKGSIYLVSSMFFLVTHFFFLSRTYFFFLWAFFVFVFLPPLLTPDPSFLSLGTSYLPPFLLPPKSFKMVIFLYNTSR